tara:strand:- start:158 stop:814 length:657 start_codon:yes stop_codon:yes gene_type:complete
MQYNENTMKVIGQFTDLSNQKSEVDVALTDTAKNLIKKYPEVMDMDWSTAKKQTPEFANSLMMSAYAKDSKLMQFLKKEKLIGGKNPVNDGIYKLTQKKSVISSDWGGTIALKLKGSNIKGKDKVNGLCHSSESNFTRTFNSIKAKAKDNGKKVNQHFAIYLTRNLTKTISPLNTVLKSRDNYTQADTVMAEFVKQKMDEIHKYVENHIKTEDIKIVS